MTGSDRPKAGADHARTTTEKPPFLANGTLGEISPYQRRKDEHYSLAFIKERNPHDY
jgi:hypothetical protein